MSRYFKPERKLKENTLVVATEDVARTKQGDLLFISYVQGGLVGYDFHKNDFAERLYPKFLTQTREATKEEIGLYLNGKRNINEVEQSTAGTNNG